MKTYGLSYINIEDYKWQDNLCSGNIYTDIKEFAKIVMPFIDNNDRNKLEEIIELLESLNNSTFLYTDKDYTYGIIIHIYNLT
jgi:hypothetical protein